MISIFLLSPMPGDHGTCDRWSMSSICNCLMILISARNLYSLAANSLCHCLCLGVIFIAFGFCIFDNSFVSNKLWNKIAHRFALPSTSWYCGCMSSNQEHYFHSSLLRLLTFSITLCTVSEHFPLECCLLQTKCKTHCPFFFENSIVSYSVVLMLYHFTII